MLPHSECPLPVLEATKTRQTPSEKKAGTLRAFDAKNTLKCTACCIRGAQLYIDPNRAYPADNNYNYLMPHDLHAAKKPPVPVIDPPSPPATPRLGPRPSAEAFTSSSTVSLERGQPRDSGQRAAAAADA